MAAKSLDELRTALLTVFEEDNSSEEFWKELDELIELINDHALWENVIGTLEKEDLKPLTYAKLQHFKDKYHAYCYEMSMWSQIESS